MNLRFYFCKMRSSYNPNYTAEATKRYFITSELYNYYPESFVCSERHKWVHLVKATLIQTLKDGSVYYPKNIILHADFVQDADCLDHFVSFCNQINERRKYEQFNAPKDFKMWLTDHEGNSISINDGYTLIVELLLEY